MAKIKLVTFNVRYGTAPDEENHWEHRWPIFGETIRALAPDILCLQEVLPFQLDHVHHVLPGRWSAAAGRNDGSPNGGEMVPIVWRTDRFERVDAGHFWLSSEPHRPGLFGWDAKHPRMTTWAALRLVEEPRTLFTVFNTHLEHRGSGHGQIARQESASLISRRVAALGPHMPVIVTGDFNSVETDPAYVILTAGGLRDAYRVIHPTRNPAEECTTHKFTGRHDGDRIDWILVSNHWTVKDAQIDRSSRGIHYPSDHYPVVAQLEIG